MYIPHELGIYVAVSKLPQKENDTYIGVESTQKICIYIK